MNSLTLAGLTLTLGLFSSAYANENFEEYKVFDLTKTETFSVKFKHADIEFKRTDTGKSSVFMSQVLQDGSSESCLHKITIEQDDKHLYLSTESNDSSWFWQSCNVKRKIVISIDNNTIRQAEIELGHASVNADAFDFATQAWAISHAKVNINQIIAQKYQLDLSHSQLDIEQVQSLDNELAGSHSSMRVRSYTGTDLINEWQHGLFTIKQGKFDAITLQSAHAQIEYNQTSLKNLLADGAHSLFTINLTKANRVKVENKHGIIKLGGDIRDLKTDSQHTYTEINQLSKAVFKVESRSTHGDIKVYVPAGSFYSYQLNDQKMRLQNTETVKELSEITVNTVHGQASVSDI